MKNKLGNTIIPEEIGDVAILIIGKLFLYHNNSWLVEKIFEEVQEFIEADFENTIGQILLESRNRLKKA